MFPPHIEDRYKHDATFNCLVDQMRAFLRMYHVTPSELREAAILAATMHENEIVRPLFITRIDELDKGVHVSLYPAMFGGASAANAPLRTASGAAKKPAPFTDHVYGVEQGITQKFRVCIRCGLSNVYVKETPSAQICSGKRDLKN